MLLVYFVFILCLEKNLCKEGKMKRTIAVLVLVAVFSLLFGVNVSGYSSSLYDEKIKEERLVLIINEKIKQDTDETKIIMDIKSIYDFAGNEYKAIELSPIGYMIYSVETGIFVERSMSSPSPYLNQYNDLYYGGPTFYYALDADKLNHTVVEEKLAAEDMKSYKDSSIELHNTLVSKKDTAVLEYINTGNINQYNQQNNISPQATVRGVIYNTNYFRNLYFFGYTDGGKCGYIALNMMIGYHDKHKNIGTDDIMDDIYWLDTKKTCLKSNEESLSEYLYSLKPYNGTNANDLERIMKEYEKTRNLTFSHTSRIKPFYTIGTVMSAIDYDRPVAAVGELNAPDGSGKVAHVVVIYIYVAKINFLGIIYDADYTVHFGWLGFNDIVLSGFIANIYFFDNV